MLEGEVIMKVSSWARIPGPLDRYLRGFGEELARLGYAPRGVQWQLQLAGHLNAWLAEAGRGSADLDAATAEEFLAARRALGYVHFLSAKALKPLLEYLRQAGAAPLPVTVAAVTPADALLERFRSYLTSERGLTAGTAWNYVHLVRPFVAGRQGADGVDLAALTAGEVAEFVVAESRVRPAKGTQHLVSALRSLLGFAHVNGLIGVSLAEAVPSVASWRLAGLPRFLEPGQAGALLASCDTGTVNGRRDLAILTVLVRLGLRSGEVAGLALEDIDWRAGEIGIRGKGGRIEKLPLPADAGETLAAYLRDGRPPAALDRSVFIRVKAPHRGLTSTGITQAVAAASKRAGLGTIYAHRLRHTAATGMLRAGASLAEVGQVLRHRHPDTTAIYAKVDTEALRALARPWPVTGPGGAR
jgi:site-specific recombinase XerD